MTRARLGAMLAVALLAAYFGLVGAMALVPARMGLPIVADSPWPAILVAFVALFALLLVMVVVFALRRPE